MQPIPRIFWVTDAEIVARPDFSGLAHAALHVTGSTAALQFRAHGLHGRRLWALASDLRRSTGASGGQLWINDRLDVALLVRADGVQLGARSVPRESALRTVGASCRIGYSAHSVDEACEAADAGHDLVVLGSIYRTDSHPDRRPLGTATIGRASDCGRPIVAIGGITPHRVQAVMESGAWGIAVRSGIWDTDDVAARAREYLDAVMTHRET